MEKEVFTVSDVYDHAASIGKDIEQIVQEYGKEAIEGKLLFNYFIVYIVRLITKLLKVFPLMYIVVIPAFLNF